MHQRNYRFYIDRAKEKQGFKYDKQVDAALGFKSSMTAVITKPGSTGHLSDEKMLELAALAGMSDIIALMDLHIWKADSEAEKTAYKEILKRISVIIIAVSVCISPLASYASVKTGQCNYGKDTVYYGKYYIGFLKRGFVKVFQWLQTILLRGPLTRQYTFAA